MRSKSIVLIVLAMGCGLVAAIGVSQLMDARSGGPANQGETQPVFVALTDIAPNEELTAQNVKTEEWPKDHLPPGASTKLEDVEGKRCRMRIYAGEPILSSKLVGAGDAVGASKDIPNGYRVEPVKVDAVTGASNLIMPGDRVDVLLFRAPQGNNPNAQVAKIVLQDIKVFAVDTHTETEFSKNKTEQGDPITAKTISLLVTPQQSLILHAASEISGTVRLVLRNPEDNTHVMVPSATNQDLFNENQQSDRDKEHLTGTDSGSDDVTSFLENQKRQNSKTADTQSQTELNGPDGKKTPGRKMTVILGAALKVVDLPGNGEPPLNQPTVGDTPAGPQQGDGSSLIPVAPPEEGGILPGDDNGG